jgi:hypothetical protein
VEQKDYEQANAEFTEQIASIEQQLEILLSNKATLERFVGFAELMLVDISAAYQRAEPEQKQGVQTLLFKEGLLYSEDQGFLNTSKPSLFSVLEKIGGRKRYVGVPDGI